MREIDDKVPADDVNCLLSLRGAIVRRAPLPAVPTESALRLGGLGYVRATGTGGVELTEAGLAFLEQYFLFCHAAGCDGILRRWAFMPPQYSGCHPDDPDVERNRAGGYYIKCLKCGSSNLLEGAEHPMQLGDYRIASVIPGV